MEGGARPRRAGGARGCGGRPAEAGRPARPADRLHRAMEGRTRPAQSAGVRPRSTRVHASKMTPPAARNADADGAGTATGVPGASGGRRVAAPGGRVVATVVPGALGRPRFSAFTQARPAALNWVRTPSSGGAGNSTP